MGNLVDFKETLDGLIEKINEKPEIIAKINNMNEIKGGYKRKSKRKRTKRFSRFHVR